MVSKQLPLSAGQIERQWEHAGFSCAVVLHGEPGHRAGYVRVPPGHPLHGQEPTFLLVHVHGGLTFAGRTLGFVGVDVSRENSEDGWWFGFHCIHPGDALIDPNLDPASLSEQALENWNLYRHLAQTFAMGKGHYWVQVEVELETEYLAEQLACFFPEGAQ